MLDLLLAGALGGVAGSFAACAASRYLEGGSLLRPSRSHCCACGCVILWHDAVPFVSFLLLRGKCRQCKENIPAYIFLAELCCALIFVLLVWRCSWSTSTVLLALFFWITVAFSLIDAALFRLPDTFLGASLVPLILLLLNGSLAPWPDPLLASLAGAGFLFVLREVYRIFRHKEGLGLGDVKLAALLGLLTDLPGIFEIFFLASSLGLIAAMIFRLGRGRMPVCVPFGPFLCLAAYAKVLWGA